MAVSQNITKFIGTAAARDFARNNLFRVVSFKTPQLNLVEDDLVYCKGADIPGRITPTATVAYQGMKMSYNKSTVEYPGADNYTLTFYLDGNGDIRHKFEVASRAIFNELQNTGGWAFPSPTTSNITLARLDSKYEIAEKFTLYGVTLKSIDSIKTQIADGDGSALEITVTLSYLYYRNTMNDQDYSSITDNRTV